MLRESYRPDPIRILLVGESPPAGGTFFYAANSRLYTATLEAISRFTPSLRQKDFLQEFKSMGFFLVDLCKEPINHLKDVDRLEKRLEGGRRLAKWLKSIPAEQPESVIVVMKEIGPYVRDALDSASRKDVKLDELPFPYDGKGHDNYVSAMVKLLFELRGKGLFD